MITQLTIAGAIEEKIIELGRESIDSAMIEFKLTFKERIPYSTIPTLSGPCYKWNQDFIENILIAMSTDSMIQFSEEEKETWDYFVNFQNYHSTSARESDANGTAIGCTVPNETNQSFVVAGDGFANNGKNGRPLELCQPPSYEIEGELAWSSLDKVLMDLYNCKELDDCNRGLEIENIYPCNTY